MFGIAPYRARLAGTPQDVERCQRLRYLAFVANRGLSADGPEGLDADEFDALCRHVMVEEAKTGTLVCCFRFLALESGAGIGLSYAARHYDLSALAAFPGRMVEMGRFCIHPAHRDPAILRVAWAEMSRVVEAEGVELLFGCSSFHGVDAEAYRDAFALLTERHLAPPRWLPRPKAPRIVEFARRFALFKPDLRRAMRVMPPLLRSYLVMGGWVSDHAVVDTELNTLHVFTGVEVSRVPKARAALLRPRGVAGA